MTPMTENEAAQVQRVMTYFEMKLGAKLDLFLELLARGHSPAAVELGPDIKRCLETFKQGVRSMSAAPEVPEEIPGEESV